MTDPIPEGFHTVTPHLAVDDAGRAIEFYTQALGAEELERHTTPDNSKILHVALKLGDSRIMLHDEFPEWGPLRNPKALGGCGVTLHLYVGDCDAAMQRAVAAGAEVTMPAQEMFWGDRYGKIRDPFGYEWSFATQVQAMSPDEKQQATREFFADGRNE